MGENKDNKAWQYIPQHLRIIGSVTSCVGKRTEDPSETAEDHSRVISAILKPSARRSGSLPPNFKHEPEAFLHVHFYFHGESVI